MKEYAVIDADGHVLESERGIRELLEPRWQRTDLFPRAAWDRSLRGKLGSQPEGPRDQLAAMDKDGIDIAVLYPTQGLSIGTIREIEYVAALARAYNDWLYEFCQANPARLKFVALTQGHDVSAAAEELRRSVTKLGAVGAVAPTHVPLRPDWGHRYYDPFYAEAERLDIGVSFHPGVTQESLGTQRFSNFISAHATEFPVEQMMALCGTVIGGVLERFPKLRLGFLEAGVGWVPYMMDRLDEEVERRGAEDAPYLTKLPSEYIKGGGIFFGVECEERTIRDAVHWGLEDTLLYSSDYPHWDSDWPHTVSMVRKRSDLSESVKRKMLRENALRFYGHRFTAELAKV